MGLALSAWAIYVWIEGKYGFSIFFNLDSRYEGFPLLFLIIGLSVIAYSIFGLMAQYAKPTFINFEELEGKNESENELSENHNLNWGIGLTAFGMLGLYLTYKPVVVILETGNIFYKNNKYGVVFTGAEAIVMHMVVFLSALLFFVSGIIYLRKHFKKKLP